MRLSRLSACLALLCAAWQSASGIILFDTDDPYRNTTTPGDNSGWQFEGTFGPFCVTPIAPLYFLAAGHIGGNVGGSMFFHGEEFKMVAVFDDVTTPTHHGTDLRIWKVDHPFPVYAPLYQGGGGAQHEIGQELRVFGQGASRGPAKFLRPAGSEVDALKGWEWGSDHYWQRWGANIVEDLPAGGQYLRAAFNANGISNEAHLSVYDSSGGVFVMENGLWKLAAVNYGVDTLNYENGSGFVAALFDAGGYYFTDSGTLILIPDEAADVPTSFYSTRVLPSMDWIASTIEDDPAVLPPESYATWLHAYYSPTEIEDPAKAGLQSDADRDGVPNLLEFAFNLDPTFAEPATHIPGVGFRGLPAARVKESGALSVEYVRRKADSGAGLTYTAQFASDLAKGDWQTSSVETVTSINPRWERVKVTDPTPGGARFTRVLVTAP